MGEDFGQGDRQEPEWCLRVSAGVCGGVWLLRGASIRVCKSRVVVGGHDGERYGSRRRKPRSWAR
jgi:hypothetical protein